MNKIIPLLYLLIFILTSNAIPQSGWFSQTSGTPFINLQSVFFISPLTGWVAGEGGTILKTTNGGINWASQNSGTTYYLRSVHFIDTVMGLAAGGYNNRIILKTTDGGNNWSTKLTQSAGDIYTIQFTTISTAWGIGITQFLKSTDGGDSWVLQPTGGPYGFYSLFFPTVSIGFTAGASGVIKKTINGGNNWNVVTTGTSEGLWAIHFTSGIGWAVGNQGTIINSLDGGSNWNTQTSGVTVNLKTIFFITQSKGWTAGQGGTILHSTNGGNNWEPQNSGTSNELHSLYFISEDTGWTVGNGGTILKTTNGGLTTNLKSIIQNKPEKYNIYQNYPNPFNPTTTIKFDIQKTSLTKMIIYNARGREIATLVNEVLNAGSYEVDWNGKGCPSGVYFYRIQTGDFIEVKKMLFIK